MRGILNVLKNKTVLVAIGVICLALLVWFVGPFVHFTSVVGRLLVILGLVLIWVIVLQIRHFREARAGADLAKGSATAESGSGAARKDAVSEDALALRKCFAEGATMLRKSGSAHTSLYELPWYAFIGPPGTGKTTLIEKSGLKFPLAQRLGTRKIAGVGGTRNCHWWFTEEAVLLDTAGRYVTQDSNATADRQGWLEFLQLLKKYRRRRPLNGLFVAYSAATLAAASDEDLERDALTIRARLDEVQSTLEISLPIYFLVTQCDLVKGFVEYFDDLDADARRQVWGFTFALNDSMQGSSLAQLGPQFGHLGERLASQLMSRLQPERDLGRRVAMLTFPAQFASLEARLESLMRNVFDANGFERTPMLRGVYFTSGTQSGTPVDRVMAAVAREFGFAMPASEQPASAGRAYFIERLLRGVVFPESGLAGTHRKLETRKALLQLCAYVGCTALVALAIVLLTISYSRNKSYLRTVDTALTQFQASPVAALAAGMPLDEILPRLDALKSVVDVAERNREPAPWSMRFGLYQARAAGEAARDSYLREVNNYVTPILAQQLNARLSRVVADPENLFESLKAYLLLTDTGRLAKNREHLAAVTDLEWQDRFAADNSVTARLEGHFAALLDSGEPLAAPLDDARVVERARGSLAGLTPARLVYGRIKRVYSADEKRGLRLDTSAGLESEKVLMRRSGAPLSAPVPYVYTRKAFAEIASTGAIKAVASFTTDDWVFGERQPSAAETARLPFDVIAVYEDDYIVAWDRLIADIGLRPVAGRAQVAEALRILGAPDSPLRNFLHTVEDNTNLVRPKPAGKPANPLSQLEAGVTALQAKVGAGSTPPGTKVTEHFRTLFTSQAAVDRCIGTLGQIHQQLDAAGGGYVGGNPNAALSQGGALDMGRALDRCAASLPAPLNAMMKQAAAAGQAAAIAQVRSDLSDRMAQQVEGGCREIVSGRYPFMRASSNDVPTGDFARLFGYGGTLDSFFRENLAPLVDTRGATWRWREVANQQVAMSAGVLTSFQRAARVREAFFPPGGQAPQVRFTLRADSMDPDLVRFVLEFDGQHFEYRHDPPQPWAATWPGPSPGVATLRFEDRQGRGPSQSWQGPWAFFRLLDTANFERRSATSYVLTFRAGGKTARVILEASSIYNPFDRDTTERFRCAN